jgi:hypothetical protein
MTVVGNRRRIKIVDSSRLHFACLVVDIYVVVSVKIHMLNWYRRKFLYKLLAYFVKS